VRYADLYSTRPLETSATIRQRVTEASNRQLDRFADEPIYSNAHMKTRHLKKYCQLDAKGQHLLEEAIQRLGLSARAYHRILKVARTIADLERESDLAPHHILEAIQYRTLDRTLF